MYLSGPIRAALAAKTIKLYLWLESVDSNVRVQVGWAHGADGVNWYKEAASIVDTSAGTDAAKGMYDGDDGDTKFGAYVRFWITVEERSAPSSLVTVQASLQAVFKPF